MNREKICKKTLNCEIQCVCAKKTQQPIKSRIHVKGAPS